MTTGLAKAYKLVIFDADGTLVKTKSGKTFRENPADWELLPQRKEVIETLHVCGINTAIASNQGGVAFGFMPEGDVRYELWRLGDSLGIHWIFFCFHHPQASIEGYRHDCDMRKPKPGMLLKAMTRVRVTAEETLMVGDRPEDEVAAAAAGCDYQDADTFFAAATPVGGV